MTTRTFHIGDIISITDGHLVSPSHMDGIYNILNWMTGDNLFTHQLPRAARECEQNLREQHPDIAEIVFPEGVFTTPREIEEWLGEQVAKYGETRKVAPLPQGEHTKIGPLTELNMMRGGDSGTIVVEI